MLSYADTLKIVEEQLKKIASERQPSELYSPIEYILSMGGKRIRPCLAIMSHSLFSDKTEDIIDAAIGIEVFHNFTLMHDDIMDNAHLRRNVDTVHVKWNDNVGILSGDAMLILAYQLIANTKQEVLSPILKLFNQTALEVCEGQQYDMNFEVNLDVTVDEYLKMIRLKTAVLLAASLAAGGITAMAEESDINALYEFGINIGIAFQLQDDYLDVFSDSKKFGKSIGGDIVANKKTFLLLSALQSDNKKLVDELTNWITKKVFVSEEKINAVKAIYKELKIAEKTQSLSKHYFELGLSHLNKVNVSKDKISQLKEVVTILIERKH